MSEQNKQIEQEKITVRVSLAGKAVIFYLRMISMAEETALRQRYAALTDEDRSAKEYEINVDALGTFSLQKPEFVLPDGAVQKHLDFIEQTPFNERVAEYAIRGFLQKLAPDISFL